MRTILYALVVIILITTAAVLGVFFWAAPRIPRLPDDLRILASSPPTEVYARDGEQLTRIGGRTYVPLNRIPPSFRQAIITAEDKRFYSHPGIDYAAAARALWINLASKGQGPGGSTITQQLAKNMFFSFRRSWERKLLEALAACAIEQKFSKDQILEAYCNLVAFGPYAFGIENAAKVYFNKTAADLTLPEAALLAGLPNAPSRLNPFYNLDAAKARQRVILERMARRGVINAAKVDSLCACPLIFRSKESARANESFPVDYALELASREVGRDVVSYGGIRISTSLDLSLQRYAESALSRGLDDLEARLKPLPEDADTRLEGALVAIEVATGQVAAVVGGRNYRQSPFNRALYAPRHPGSSFKPVVYLTALEKGTVSPATVLQDAPFTIKLVAKRTWTTRNFSGGYRGPVTVKFGLMKSINTISAQLIAKTGPEAVVQTAERLGLKRGLEPFYTLCLGAQEMTPLEVAGMYSTLAREGVAIDPTFLQRIESRGRDVLYESFSARETHFDPRVVYTLLDIMKDVLDGGTGVAVRQRGFRGAAFGKTGTSTDFHDAWFCGATPDLAVVVWVGYDDSRSMRLTNGVGVTGSIGAAPIWADFMIRATAGQPSRSFPRPEGLTTLFMAPATGKVSRIPEASGWITVTVPDEQAHRLLTVQPYIPAVDSLKSLTPVISDSLAAESDSLAPETPED